MATLNIHSLGNSNEVAVTTRDPIWRSIIAEAILEAKKEPILSSFLYASILSHDCLERALGFVLANKLQDSALQATQLMDIFNHAIMNDSGFEHTIRQDIQAFKDRNPACASYSWALLYLKFYFRGTIRWNHIVFPIYYGIKEEKF